MARRRKPMRVETHEEAQQNPNPDYARIVLPESGESLEEVLEVIKTNRRCGKCSHFDYELGQQALTGRDNVMKQLIRERELSSLAHAIRTNEIGACRHWSQGADRLHLVHAMSPAKVARQFTGSYTRKNRNESVDCPDYQEVSGRVLRFFKRLCGKS